MQEVSGSIPLGSTKGFHAAKARRPPGYLLKENVPEGQVPPTDEFLN